jgi:antitoxin component of MazEF toxin-antitoxin module
MRFYTRRVAVVPVINNLTKRGNSLALVIEKPVLELLGVNADTAFDVSTDGQVLILSPIRDAARREAFSGALDKDNARYPKALKKPAE